MKACRSWKLAVAGEGDEGSSEGFRQAVLGGGRTNPGR